LPVEMENSFRNTGKTILKKAVELIWSRILDGTTEAFGTELERRLF
jgi:hypothetical protein